MGAQEYINDRVNNQIKWYSKKATINKQLYIWSKGLVIGLGALIPFVTGLMTPETTWLTYVIATLGVLVAILTSVSALLKLQEKWTEYRTTSENLKHEKYLYLTKSGFYESEDDLFKTFVSRIENLISKENSTWSQYINDKKD